MEGVEDRAAQRWTLVLASAGSLMVALDALIVATALADIGRQFEASIESLEWTVNAYTLSFAVLLMTAAAIGDRLGRREVFAAGLLLFAAASAACAVSQSVGWLIGARAVQGVGAAMIMPMALAQISAAFPPSRRGWALGVYSSITALSTIVGPVLGGLITEGIAWQWIFWVNVPVGLVVVASTLARLPRIRGADARLDIPGLFLVTGAAFGLVWGLVRANAAGWGSLETLGSIGSGLVLFGVFVAWERLASAPMIPLRLFRLRVFTAGNTATFLLFGALMGAIFFLAQFQQVALGQGPLVAGLRLLPWGLAVVVMAPFAGRIAARIGDANTVAAGLIVHAAGLAWLAIIASPSLAYAAMIAPMVAAGAGFAVSVPIVQKAVVSAVPPSDIGKASGTLSMNRQLGGAFGLAIVVAAFSYGGGQATPQAFAEGYAAGMWIAALLSLGGAIAGLWLSPRRRVAAAIRIDGGETA